MRASAPNPLLFESPCADQRLAVACDFLRQIPRDQGALIVADSPLAMQWLVARALRASSAVEARFNWQRKTLAGLMDELALPALAAERRTQLRGLGRLGLCTRVVAVLGAQGQLGRYGQIAAAPGFVRALAQTLSELRLARVSADALSVEDPVLGRFLACYEAELERLSLADEALVLERARAACEGAQRFAGLPLLLLDLGLAHSAQADLIGALAARAPSVCATLVRGDDRAEGNLLFALAGRASVQRSEPTASEDLARLKAQLFAPRDQGGPPSVRGGVQIVSSPGESREAVEVARAILQAAARGVPFDRMAVALRAVEVYRAPLEEALRRAEVPAYYAEGVRRPLPEGRALLLLLECARDGLSRRAFAEYLSLGVFPRHVPGAASNASRWERLIVRAGVGGDAARWTRRLESLRQQLTDARDEPHAEAAEREEAARELEALEQLAPFVGALLPALEALASAQSWGVLLAGIQRVAEQGLTDAELVSDALAELAPLTELSPVSIVDAERILAQRLSSSVLRSSGYGAGQVFVATPDELRGRSFERVFVLGLAEQLFPPRLSEDPLLPDRLRRMLSTELPLLEERAARERLALQICVGAAERALTLTYPRFDAEHGRPRVPSFYGLAVLHAMEGALPAFDELARRALPGAAARMGFPAPDDPVLAIDDAEYDLAVLGQLLQKPPAQRVGGLRYLLSHPHLARALRFRARRWSVARFTACDGLVLDNNDESRALLAPFQLERQAYSASHLALMAACPYRFYLQAIQGLRVREPDEIEESLRPRERGVLMHRVQQVVLTELAQRGQLPLTPAALPEALALLRERFDQLSLEAAEQRGLGSTRSWTESLASLLHDLEEWLRLMLYEPDWTPAHFELGFGVTRDRHALDPESVSAPAVLDRLRLKGVIDLVERRADRDEEGRSVLRVTDYKSGRRDERKSFITHGGRALQPLLYALAVEQLFPGARVTSGRLYFCTSHGDFASEQVPLDATARAVFADWVGALDALLREGFLPASPAKDACASCPGLSVCGPYEEKERVPLVKREGLKRLAALHQLRNLP